MAVKTKGWSKERRAKQAENCRKTRPSDHATGPKTADGKAKTAQNAYKHGLRSADILELRRLLRIQKECVKGILNANCPPPKNPPY